MWFEKSADLSFAGDKDDRALVELVERPRIRLATKALARLPADAPRAVVFNEEEEGTEWG